MQWAEWVSCWTGDSELGLSQAWVQVLALTLNLTLGNLQGLLKGAHHWSSAVFFAS